MADGVWAGVLDIPWRAQGVERKGGVWGFNKDVPLTPEREIGRSISYVHTFFIIVSLFICYTHMQHFQSLFFFFSFYMKAYM